MLGSAAGLTLFLCAWNNVVVTRLPGYPGSYVVANLAATAALLGAALRSRLSWVDLGLARQRLGAGARWGGACFALIAAGYAIALSVPGLRTLLTDARVAGLDGGAIAYQVLVRIPLGTVLWEEVAFRGVLLAVLSLAMSTRAATVVAAVTFGIWHVRPTVSAVAANDLPGGPALEAVAVALGCLFTGVAGLLFAWLRLRSGSLLAPVLLHLATNTLGMLAAAVAHRMG